ncbi:MAG: type II toxin-antitoxin system RelE/ParE family toxin [Candidatus Nanoarchaeia archaeon]|nr:type II toxin-antitoxin system RelE/ParE family toxin [Candidatus Nanoarchaeia archaeon]
MYDIIFDVFAIKYLKKINKILAKRIYDKIIESKNNPYRYFIHLTNCDKYKLRVGNYRVIAEIKQEKIFILKIGHRHNIYD